MAEPLHPPVLQLDASPLQSRAGNGLKRWIGQLGPGLAVLWVCLIGGAGLFAPWSSLGDPGEMDLLHMLQGPSMSHWLGTDSLGRDILTRIVFGARISLLVGLGSVVLGLAVGGTLGVLAGYYRGWLDSVLMGMMNVMLAFPALVLAIVIVGYLGASLLNVIVAIGMLFIPAFARIARANTLTFREREFVTVSRTLGASDFRILRLEILPNLLGPLLSYSLVMFAVAILAEASLGFLGLSVPPPAPSWGSMINDARSNLDTAIHTIAMPGLVMLLTVIAFNILGERAQRYFDVRESAL